MATLVTLVGALAVSGPLVANESNDLDILVDKFQQGSYSSRGADGCMMCHRRDEGVADIFVSAHGKTDNGPMAGLQCEACHGPQGKHRGKNEPMLSFGKDSALTADMQNSVCLGCHQGTQAHWSYSLHKLEEVSCVSCHSIHTANDAVLDRSNQVAACTSCHLKQKGDINKRSSHPMTNEQMVYSPYINKASRYSSFKVYVIKLS
ncbi:hypothetical protein GCM10007894_14900 [Paraferrimonas haliotis]|uniref:Cytochrome c-type protein NrfB-like domain-containing protein n=2 Tax=Paraferrimonas haliotis TaxID=2013866 RepID=A0AA37TPW1_9GAMM|nr:hypothetical protein GCM10007894_14900 [Paraferrimonas haliotis]